jgi:hypothetical protein
MQDKLDAIKALLQDQHFLDVMEELKQQHISTIIYSNDQDKDIREQAYQRIACYNELMTHLESIAKTGEIKSKSWKIL